MSPEIGIVLFVMLLWGPTALWMGYRAIRGPRRRVEDGGTISVASDRAQAAPDPVQELVGPDGFWICGSCRSLNRREAKRCYGCRAARDAAGPGAAPGAPPGAAPEAPATDWVPVMAASGTRSGVMVEGVTRSAVLAGSLTGSGGMADGRSGSPGMAAATGAPESAPAAGRSAPSRGRKGRAAAPEPVPVAPPPGAEPVPAPPRAPEAGSAAGRSAPSRARKSRAAAPEPVPVAPRPGAEPVPAPPETLTEVLVCPFLGWKDDPSTRFDFPDPGNRCHANPDRVAASLGSPRRFVPAGGGRSRTIDAEHQRSHCLTTAHRACARYPAVDEARHP